MFVFISHDELSNYIGTQYLSHIVASARKWLRNIVGNELLEIETVPIEYLSLKGVEETTSCEYELKKTVVNFRAARNGRSINPLKDYTTLTYIDIPYSEILEKEPSEYGCNEDKIDIKKKLRLRIAHELAHVIFYGILIRYKKDVVKKARSTNPVAEKFITQVSEDLNQREKYSYSSNKSLRSFSDQVESIVSILAIIIMSEKCRFHSQDYEAYLYNGLEEIIEHMK